MILIYEYVDKKTLKPLYVGQTKHLNKRDCQHRNNGNCPFDKILTKRGQEIGLAILEVVNSQVDADYFETYYIIAHKTWYGMGGYNFFLSRSFDVKAHRDALRLAGTGRIFSNEHREKLRKARTGRKQSQLTRQKVKENHAPCSGENGAFYGRKHSAESKKRMSDYKWSNVNVSRLIELCKQGINFRKVGEILGCSRSAVSRRYYKECPSAIGTRYRMNYGCANGRFGKPVSAETRLLISDGIKKAHIKKRTLMHFEPLQPLPTH